MSNNKANNLSKVTIKTVAEKAGVSIKTVSRVINKESSVRGSTREKVQAIIAQLGYEPSPAAQALASNRSKIIGLIYDNPSAAYVMAVQTGALKACASEDFNLVIHPCDHTSETLTDELINFVQRSRLDGLILTPPVCDLDEMIDVLISKGINIVSIAPAKQRSSITSVSCNDEKIVEEIISKLIHSGHKDIGFITGPSDHGAAYKRLAGYRSALQKAGIDIDTNMVVPGMFSFESGVTAGSTLLKSNYKKPTAIFASNDYMAAGVMSAAHELGVKVPEELMVIGFDDAPVSRQIWPTLTTVKQPVTEMAESVTRLLIAKVKDKKKPVAHEHFLAEFQERLSTNLK